MNVELFLSREKKESHEKKMLTIVKHIKTMEGERRVSRVDDRYPLISSLLAPSNMTMRYFFLHSYDDDDGDQKQAPNFFSQSSKQ